jgi:hypothetical protein
MSEIPRNANKFGVAGMAMTTMSHDAIQMYRNDTSLGGPKHFRSNAPTQGGRPGGGSVEGVGVHPNRGWIPSGSSYP